MLTNYAFCAKSSIINPGGNILWKFYLPKVSCQRSCSEVLGIVLFLKHISIMKTDTMIENFPKNYLISSFWIRSFLWISEPMRNTNLRKKHIGLKFLLWLQALLVWCISGYRIVLQRPVYWPRAYFSYGFCRWRVRLSFLWYDKPGSRKTTPSFFFHQ